jgi:hypothetical protein
MPIPAIPLVYAYLPVQQSKFIQNSPLGYNQLNYYAPISQQQTGVLVELLPVPHIPLEVWS